MHISSTEITFQDQLTMDGVAKTN